MIAPLLCPFRLTAFYTEGKGAKAPDMEEFAPCIHGKCAMWREAIRTIKVGDRHKPVHVGFCGLAGRPW